MFAFFSRTTLLSFSVFFRMLIIMPFFFLIVGALLFAFIYYVPLLGPLVAGITVSISIMFLNFLCLRAGLAASVGVGQMDIGRLIGASIKYGLFLALISMFFGLLVAGFIAILQKYGFVNASSQMGILYSSGYSDLFALDPVFLLTIGFFFVATSAVYAAMVVPMAATAAAEPEDTKLDFFGGAGSNFVPLLILFLAISAISTGFGVLAKGFAFLFSALGYAVTGGFTEWTSAAASNGLILAGSMPELLIFFGFLMLAIWLYCLQYSGGVIAYLNHRQRDEDIRQERMHVAQSDPEVIRNLRKSRS